MVNLSSLNLRKHSLQRRLFLTMLVLSMLLLGLFFVGMHFVLGYTDTKQRMVKNLNFQLDIFARETTSYYQGLATMSILLSRESGGIVENYLAENHLAIDDLNNSQERLMDIQKRLIDPLRHKLFEANCTGAFLMLQATVDTKSNHADSSRTGLYLQRGTLDASDHNVLLYRGFSSIGRKKGYMPHRKWRLEFDTDLFPNYTDLLQHAKAPLTTNFCTTDIFTLPGTSEKAMLMVVPLLGSHGEVYGICGLEVNQSYFKQTFAQLSPLNRATFCLSKGNRQFTDAKDCFSAGITSGYYSAPLGTFRHLYKEGLRTRSLSIRKHGVDSIYRRNEGNHDFPKKCRFFAARSHSETGLRLSCLAKYVSRGFVNFNSFAVGGRTLYLFQHGLSHSAEKKHSKDTAENLYGKRLIHYRNR